MSTRSELLKLEFTTYLSTEKLLNSEVELMNAYIDVDADIYKIHSDRFDLLEKKLNKQLSTACEAFKLETFEFLELLENYQNK